MKKILIPIEFKNNSDKVIEYAVHLHKNEACAFYLLNTYSLNISGLQALNFLKASKDWFEKPKQKSEKGLVILVDKYSVIYKEHKHQFYALSECESLIRGIQKTIENLKIDLIIMATKSKKEKCFDKYATNTERIIENIRKCPLIIMSENQTIE